MRLQGHAEGAFSRLQQFSGEAGGLSGKIMWREVIDHA